MIRTEISLFLKNEPGELGKLTRLLSNANINVDALTIQDASHYVQELFKARGKSIKRIASVSNYNMMKRDSAEFALIRLLTNKTDEAEQLLGENDYLFDTMDVITLELENEPGTLADITEKLGNMGININYVYGSVFDPKEKCLFVIAAEDIDAAAKALR
ncbi:ACT domain-containing protein [bacterium]|nr:ACT domain-containing protein [bacterium]